jgi:hypothetical protein
MTQKAGAATTMASVTRSLVAQDVAPTASKRAAIGAVAGAKTDAAARRTLNRK